MTLMMQGYQQRSGLQVQENSMERGRKKMVFWGQRNSYDKASSWMPWAHKFPTAGQSNWLSQNSNEEDCGHQGVDYFGGSFWRASKWHFLYLGNVIECNLYFIRFILNLIWIGSVNGWSRRVDGIFETYFTTKKNTGALCSHGSAPQKEMLLLCSFLYSKKA